MTTIPDPSHGAAAVGYHLRPSQVAWLRLQRPDKLNAINPEMIAGLRGGLVRARNEGARVIVITGSGKAFCAGSDLTHGLQELQRDPQSLAGMLGDAKSLMTEIERCPIPVIAAVNGAAVAGGLELVLACDLVVAASEATLADGHAAYGLFPGGGGSVRLPRIVGVTRAKHLLFTGRHASAAEMHMLGVVNEVVPGPALEDAVQILAEKLSRGSATSLARMKHVIDVGMDLPQDRAIDLERRESLAHLASDDAAEGLAAFAERRRPVFQEMP